MHEATFVTGDTVTSSSCAQNIACSTFYNRLEIDRWSILKRLVECSMRCFVQDDEVAVLPATKVASCIVSFTVQYLHISNTCYQIFHNHI